MKCNYCHLEAIRKRELEIGCKIIQRGNIIFSIPNNINFNNIPQKDQMDYFVAEYKEIPKSCSCGGKK